MVSPQQPQDFPGPGPSPGVTVPAGQSSVFPGHCAHLLLTGENPRTHRHLMSVEGTGDPPHRLNNSLWPQPTLGS